MTTSPSVVALGADIEADIRIRKLKATGAEGRRPAHVLHDETMMMQDWESNC